MSPTVRMQSGTDSYNAVPYICIFPGCQKDNLVGHKRYIMCLAIMAGSHVCGHMDLPADGVIQRYRDIIFHMMMVKGRNGLMGKEE